MKQLLQNKFSQFYERIFPQPIELTDEEKTEIIDDFNGGDEGRRIKARIKMINVAFNVLESAVAGVAFQYYKNYHDSDEVSPNYKEFVRENFETLIALSICSAAGIALEFTRRLAISQVNSRSHITSQNIKAQIAALTPKQLTDAIRDIENGDENALKIKLPRSIPFIRNNQKYILGFSSVYMSSLSADQQLLVFAASMAISSFAIDQFEKRIYQGSKISSMVDGIENFMLSVIPFLNQEDVRQVQNAQSILGKRLSEKMTEEEIRKFSSSIKSKMQEVLREKDFTNELGQFFLTVAQTSTFLTPVILNPGEKLVEDERFASALDFVIGSIARDAFGLIRDRLSSSEHKVVPVDQEENDELDDFSVQQVEEQENQDNLVVGNEVAVEMVNQTINAEILTRDEESLRLDEEQTISQKNSSEKSENENNPSTKLSPRSKTSNIKPYELIR